MSTHSHVDLAWLAKQFPDLANIQMLAAGGQKEVYSASHFDDGEVVLKLMHPGSDPSRAERELEAISRVQGAKVPRMLAHGQLIEKTGTIVWFREQRVSGESLDKTIKAGVLSVHDLLRLALHVTEALVAAEEVSIVHRDVKPANIIKATSGEFWLIDFGIARHLDLVSLTPTAAPGGLFTPGYAPIEQCRNDKQDIDARVDLFALGVTLYEAATGVNPHQAGARDQFEAIKRASERALPRLPDTVPPDFADLVATMAQTSRVRRMGTAREAYDWIKEICDREGVR